MSDKTKFYADQARIRRSMEDQRAHDAARGDTQPRCLCGKTACEVDKLWAVQDRGRTKYYCAACAPDGTLA